MKYEVGRKYIARLRDDPKRWYDAPAVIKEIDKQKGLMIVEVFTDVHRKHKYNLDGVRLDGEAYLVEA